ncbi:radical SAM family heme chaperone HemW [Massilibacteroides sp.]|uniref:radical SAM family heme chaperone HemW n=1 Tax=Massilibacteroides sp. TaxID=2034766 RepID=UPI002633F1C6|nr:radical SAM family heme chaperone HemW [Massilibacteroides sp.]MDD4515542.1 radical SAM family heme chaperone HemW [Massilibacteroides sp.]
MAGLYIHVPFCAKRCIYCDFFTSTNQSTKAAYIDAVCKELVLRKDYLNGEAVQTIYFGGGTPSQLSAKDFERIFNVIHQYYNTANCNEITIEANPDDMTEAYVTSLRQLPFNRVSMGVQSFQPEDLVFLNRRHDRRQAIDAVAICKANGLPNISIDLIYGLPGQTPEQWNQNLEEAIALNVPHLSAYHLIYEDGTPLNKLKTSGKVIPVSEELSEDFFGLLIKKLRMAGYLHYEISNFALPDCFSKHNSSYWNETKYLGIGPSAHSYDKESRQWNVASMKHYLNGISAGTPDMEKELLDNNTKYNEYIITGLRTMWGINLEKIEEEYGAEKKLFCLKQADTYIKNGLILEKNDSLRLSSEGIFISDRIMSDLLWV